MSADSGRTLYEELGGSSGIEEIVDRFIVEIAFDNRVFERFADSNVERFREKITEHFCVLANGPCVYTGDSMIDTHAGMQISDAEFNAIVENLITAMDESGSPIAAQNKLLARLAVLKDEIAGI
ncbi:group I truncated hemoglobin [Pseudohongiella spirulinae]|nr:group 1 truncated hemoglobin [Pseudohongiella spirulinae]